MKSLRVQKVAVVLELDLEEALWLKRLVQNPLNPEGDPTKEDPKDAQMRSKFWDALLGIKEMLPGERAV